MDEVDGRLFALIVAKDAVLEQPPEDLGWLKYKQHDIKVFDPARAGIQFPRLNAQKGVLAVGRPPSTTPIRIAMDPELPGNPDHSLLAAEARRILSIPLALRDIRPLADASEIARRLTLKLKPELEVGDLIPGSTSPMPRPVPGGAKLPIGLTIRLHVDKASVRADLAGRTGKRASPRGTTITHQEMYPDVRGMAANSQLLRALERGVFLL